MNLSNLKPAKGSTKKTKRIGRGQASGYGGTSGKGHKGQQSRSGYKRKKGFEGGQMPLQRRLPKRGFKNINRIVYKPLNLDRLQEIIDKHSLKEVNVDALVQNKIVDKNDRIKILGSGELKSKINIEAHAFSASAKKIIEEKGGTTTTIE